MPATEPTVAVVDPTRDLHWDEMISRMAGSTVFHSAAWARVLGESYGYAPLYLVATNKNNGSAVLALMEVKSWLTGKRGVSLPFTDECETLASDEGSARLIVEKATGLGRERMWQTIEMRGQKGPFSPTDAVGAPYLGHVLDLRIGERALFEKVASPVRRAIRKAEREDACVQVGCTALALRTYYGLHCLTRKRHGLPPQPWSFFSNIQRHLFQVNGGFVVLSYWRDRPVAGAVFLCHGRRAVYKYGASNLAFQSLRANNLVMWEAICWLVRNGFETLNFGRTSAQNDGLRRFKLGWGTSEYPISYQKFDYRKNRYVAEADAAYGWHNTIFSRLPIWLSKMAGSFLYRHWA
jgi:hypothetical protein